MKNAMQLKAIIKNLAKEKHISAQLSKWDYHENDIMEIFLSRLSGSDYTHK